MRKFSLLTAILLLASAWMLAQSSTAPSSQYPSSAPSSQQPAQQPQQESQEVAKGAEHAASTTVEGCIGGTAGAYTLTDSSGKTYELAGDTSKLGEHVGHQVKVTGSLASAAGAAASSAAGATPTLTVKKIKMESANCTNK